MLSFYFVGKMQESLKASILLTISASHYKKCMLRSQMPVLSAKIRAKAFRFYVIDRAALFPISFDQNLAIFVCNVHQTVSL